MNEPTKPVIFRKGLNLKHEVADVLADDYESAIVEQVKQSEYVYRAGRLALFLAREFGFCYGVDRAVDYAYQTRLKFPDRQVYLTGEIIHNPHVNSKLRSSGIGFLSDPDAKVNQLGPESVVIIPAFGVPIQQLQQYERQGCTLVDTTCGSVLNVWKNVKQYSKDGFTSIIHGKIHHEETQATASQALQDPKGRYLVVLDRYEASVICAFIKNGKDRNKVLNICQKSASPGFEPDNDLRYIGLANQTTMLMSESLEIGEMFRQAMIERYGKTELTKRHRAFDTICSATQDRQDAIEELLNEHRLDLMIVIGGYNSSNTRNLTRLSSQRVKTYQIANAECLVSKTTLNHLPLEQNFHDPTEASTTGWLPSTGPLSIGLTAGASTPNNIVGQVINRLETLTANDSSH